KGLRAVRRALRPIIRSLQRHGMPRNEEWGDLATYYVSRRDPVEAALGAAKNIVHLTYSERAQPLHESRLKSWRELIAVERNAQATLLRCIFGNHFRPVTVNPAWLAPTVTTLARAIYEERAFDRMPILADALEDAGCGNADILQHCREPGEHARG